MCSSCDTGKMPCGRRWQARVEKPKRLHLKCSRLVWPGQACTRPRSRQLLPVVDKVECVYAAEACRSVITRTSVEAWKHSVGRIAAGARSAAAAAAGGARQKQCKGHQSENRTPVALLNSQSHHQEAYGEEACQSDHADRRSKAVGAG